MTSEKTTLHNELDVLSAFVEIKNTVPFRKDFPCRQAPPNSLFYFAFSTYREQYYRTAKANYLTIFRGLRTLTAWKLLLEQYEIETDLRYECFIDYIDPQHTSILDTCLSIKDTLYAGAAKLSIIGKMGLEGCDFVQKNELAYSYNQWQAELKKHHYECEEYQAFIEGVDKYYNSSTFKQLKRSHGGRHHDTYPSIWMTHTVPRYETSADNATIFSIVETEMISLEEELELIEEALPYIGAIYEAFFDYADAPVQKGIVPNLC